MRVSPPHVERGWTLDDLEHLPDDGQRYELVDGGLVVTPPPTQRHQILASGLRDRLQAVVPQGWRMQYELPLVRRRHAEGSRRRRPPLAPAAPDGRRPQPDRSGRRRAARRGRASARPTDRPLRKPGEYAEAGIALFWRLEIDPDLVLHPFVLRGGSYEPVAPVTGRGNVPVPWGSIDLDVTALGD